ncbi:MAG: glutathione binding-like protein [Rhizobiaceae bacterium]
MKLYYFADGCSLATHISLREAGIVPELFAVDVQTRQIANGGGPYPAVNPKGYVPALVFDDGSMLTENVALLDWVAQQAGHLKPRSEMERTRQIEALTFISTEIHRMFLVYFFMPGEEAKPVLRDSILRRFAHIAERLDTDYMLGDSFSVADAFLYVILRWAKMSDMDVPDGFDAYMAQIEQRPTVQAALQAEGIRPYLAEAA